MGTLSRFLAYPKIYRLSIAFTPLADVITGYAAVSETTNGRLLLNVRLVCACLASTAVFCFGTALNDFLDRHKDAVLEPNRPIPSGLISPGAALTASLVMAASAIALGLSVGVRTAAAVGVVLLLATTYNLFSRRWDWLGVLNLALIRSADLFVGVSLVEPTEGLAWDSNGIPVYFVAAIYGGYALALSIVALGERGQRKLDIRWPSCAAILLLLVAALTAALNGHILPALLLWLLLAPRLLITFTALPCHIESLVGEMISGYFILGALFVLIGGHLLFVLILLTLYLLSRLLSRLFPPS